MEIVLGIAGVLALAWIGLALALLIARPRRGRLGEFVRLMPDIVRLIHRLMRDPTVHASIKVRIALLLGYLALPIDLIPDFIPVLGYADDAIIAAIVVRSVLRGVGREKVGELWPGSPDGLAALVRATGQDGK